MARAFKMFSFLDIDRNYGLKFLKYMKTGPGKYKASLLRSLHFTSTLLIQLMS